MNPLIIITILAFLLIGSIVIIWKQRGELKRKEEVVYQAQRLADQASTMIAKFDRDGDGRPGGSLKR